MFSTRLLTIRRNRLIVVASTLLRNSSSRGLFSTTSTNLMTASSSENNTPAPPPPTSAPSKFIIPPPRSQKLSDLATTHCPICKTQTHIKELLRHLNNDHPQQIQSGEIDKDLVRKLIRERYTTLHAAIKQVWASNSPKGAVADKSKGGFPCRHCDRDETGLQPLFPTVDSLMKHIGNLHDGKNGVDIDEEEVPKRLSADDVNQTIEILKNGTNSGITTTNESASNSTVNSSSSPSKESPSNNQNVVGVSISELTSSIFAMNESGGENVLGGIPEAPSAVSSSSNINNHNSQQQQVLAYRCELCNKQTDREIDMLQHYDNAHGDIVFNLGLSKKLTIRNFYGNDEIEEESGQNGNGNSSPAVPLDEYEENSFSAISENNNNNLGSSFKAENNNECWTTPILAPYSGIPRTLIIPYVGTGNRNNNINSGVTEEISKQEDKILAAGEQEQQKQAGQEENEDHQQHETPLIIPEDENGVVDFSATPPPPPPKSSKEAGAPATSPSTTNNTVSPSATTTTSTETTNNLLRCQHCGAKLKSAQSFEMHLKDKHGIIMSNDHNAVKTGAPSTIDDDNSSSSPRLPLEDLIARAELSNMKYYCTFGTCRRKQFSSSTAFEAHVQAKHQDVDFKTELEKILRNKFESNNVAENGNQDENKKSQSGGESNSVLSNSLTCNVCGKTGFTSYYAFASHLQDKHDIVIEKYASGVNIKKSSNVFVLSSSIFDASTAQNEPFYSENNNSNDTSDNFTSSSSSLRQQQESVAYECEHCGKSFSTFNGYDNHVRSKHHVTPTRLILKKSSTNTTIGNQSQQQQTILTNTAIPTTPTSSQQHHQAPPPSFPSDLASFTARNSKSLSENEEDSWQTNSMNQQQQNFHQQQQTQQSNFAPPPPSSPSTNNTNTMMNQLKNPWWCNPCNRGFGSPQALQGHLMSKHGYRPPNATTIPCPVAGCRKTAADQFALVEHLKQAHRSTGEISEAELKRYDIGDGFACGECGKKFLIEHELNTHFMNTHSGLQRPMTMSPHNDGASGDDNGDDDESAAYGRRNFQTRTGSKKFRKRF